MVAAAVRLPRREPIKIQSFDYAQDTNAEFRIQNEIINIFTDY